MRFAVRSAVKWRRRLPLVVGVGPALTVAVGLGLQPKACPADEQGRRGVIIEAVYVLDDRPLPLPDGAAPSEAKGFRLGGISDLHFSGSEIAASGSGVGLRFWAVTDRGPNGVASRPMSLGEPPAEMRTLPVPAYAPLIVELVAEPAGDVTREGVLRVAGTIRLASPSGRPASGRPTPTPNANKPIVDPSTFKPLSADPYGFDSEGVVRLRDGRFWIADEYAPSLAEISVDGKLLARFIPHGLRFEGGEGVLHDALPADYSRRRDNRGFESLAISPDEAIVFAMLQSPLEKSRDSSEPTGSVRLLAFDPQARRPVAEYLYSLGDPADTTRGSDGDGKVSAMAALGPASLLVLEQSDHHSRLYAVDLPIAGGPRSDPAAAENSSASKTVPPIPVSKRLIVDLVPLVAVLHADIAPEQPCPPMKAADLKLEGLAILDDQRVAIVNDNDFDIRPDGVGGSDPPQRRTCLWVLRLADGIR